MSLSTGLLIAHYAQLQACVLEKVPASVQTRRCVCAAPSSGQQMPRQPPSSPRPLPGIIVFSPSPDCPGHGVHVLSFVLWKHHSNKLFLNYFFYFFFQENRQQQKHKCTSGCVSGSWKGSNFFVRWMWPGLGTWPDCCPSLVLFGIINIAQSQESGFTFTEMAEDTFVTPRPPSCWNPWGP